MIKRFRTGWSTLVTLAVLLALVACATPPTTSVTEPASDEPLTLTVMAAASLTDAFNELGAMFQEAHPNVEVTFNFAGSQQLAQQLSEGAPADVFASANQRQMDVVVEAGRIDSGAARVFVQNRLVIIYPSTNPAQLSTLADLAKPGLKLILAASDVPVGQYSLDFLAKAAEDATLGSDFEQSVIANVVSYEENVKSVLTKVALGEGDAGIVYSSDISGEYANQVGRIDIPDELNIIASYPIAVVKDSQYAESAEAFVAFVLSAEGQAVLQKYGFLSPSPN